MRHIEVKMKVELIQKTEDPVKTIADIASICYDSHPDNPMGLVKHLYKNGHHSVFEHVAGKFDFLMDFWYNIIIKERGK